MVSKKKKKVPIPRKLVVALEPAPFLAPSVSFLGASKILVLLFENARSLELSLRRVHDHYEGGRLKGPLKGVNMPFATMEIFSKECGWVSEEERQVWDSISHLGGEYLIACLKRDVSSQKHEYAHAMYHMDLEYRGFAENLYNQLSKQCKVAIGKELELRNYASDKWIDEWQAYTVETCREFGRKWVDELSAPHQHLRSRLGKLPSLVSTAIEDEQDIDLLPQERLAARLDATC